MSNVNLNETAPTQFQDIGGCRAAANAQAGPRDLTEARAQAVIGPWYSQLTAATRGDVKTIWEKVVGPDYQTCSGYLSGECLGRDAAIKLIGGLTQAIPDLTFQIKEVLISGDRVTVVGEMAGTPAGDLFGGVPHTGKSFRMMTLDVQTIKDGKIVKTIHMENRLSALNQLCAK
jgi:predicted ester cyclase